MDINNHLTQTLLIGLGLLTIYFAFKIAHFVLKVVLHLIGLVLLGVAVWWWFFANQRLTLCIYGVRFI